MRVYKKVKRESHVALRHLDDNKSNSFQQLFLTKLPFTLQYDLVIDLTKSLPVENKFNIEDEEKARSIGFKDLLIVTYISKIIRRGFGNRVLNVVPRLEVEDSSHVLKKFFFGINLNPEEAFNFIELGPALNDHIAAADFRIFWGNLSSDRRFRDGSTHVAVYFKTNTIKGKRNIIKKNCKFCCWRKT
ncbi:hypothetical protein NQ314_019045 [Rhamnusium bicolor]|uniref:Nucleolar protein 6 n=1 Tax=Rhamnusium bicolor TaxID=1586634 RepID=A0AAV8WQ12_9CUCU|nr:hypothetical protein NQ314_019045 [Rhamnusium bicolor]